MIRRIMRISPRTWLIILTHTSFNNVLPFCCGQYVFQNLRFRFQNHLFTLKLDIVALLLQHQISYQCKIGRAEWSSTHFPGLIFYAYLKLGFDLSLFTFRIHIAAIKLDYATQMFPQVSWLCDEDFGDETRFGKWCNINPLVSGFNITDGVLPVPQEAVDYRRSLLTLSSFSFSDR